MLSWSSFVLGDWNKDNNDKGMRIRMMMIWWQCDDRDDDDDDDDDCDDESRVCPADTTASCTNNTKPTTAGALYMQALFWNKVRNKKQILSFIHASHKHTDFRILVLRQSQAGSDWGEQVEEKKRRKNGGGEIDCYFLLVMMMAMSTGDDGGDRQGGGGGVGWWGV